MAEFYSAAAGQSPPLPWTNLSPPHTSHWHARAASQCFCWCFVLRPPPIYRSPIHAGTPLWIDTYPVNFLPSSARRPSSNSFSFNFSLPHSFPNFPCLSGRLSPIPLHLGVLPIPRVRKLGLGRADISGDVERLLNRNGSGSRFMAPLHPAGQTKRPLPHHGFLQIVPAAQAAG